MVKTRSVAARLTLADYAALQEIPGATDSHKIRTLIREADIANSVAIATATAVLPAIEALAAEVFGRLDDVKQHVSQTATSLDSRDKQRAELLAELIQSLVSGGGGK